MTFDEFFQTDRYGVSKGVSENKIGDTAMIYEDHQRIVTAKAAQNFRNAIKELSQIPKEEITDLEELQIHIRSLKQQAEELEAEKSGIRID